MAELTPERVKQLTEILTPVIGGAETARRGHIAATAGPDHPLIWEINYTGSDAEYVRNLIFQLAHFGEIERGRPALIALLSTVRNLVGVDRQQTIDWLSRELGGPVTLAPDTWRSKLFISYRRASWPFTHALARDLASHLPDADIFIDYRNIDKTRFEDSILGHLRASDGVLVIVSPETFSPRVHELGDWLRREIAEALHLKIPIIQVGVEGLVAPAKDLPRDIQAICEMQAVKIYPEYWSPGIASLAKFIKTVIPATSQATQRQTRPAPAALPADPPPVEAAQPNERLLGLGEAIQEVVRLRQETEQDGQIKHLEQAKALLESVIRTGRLSDYELRLLREELADLVTETEAISARLEAERIAAERRNALNQRIMAAKAWAKNQKTLSRAITLVKQLRQDYPDFNKQHPDFPAELAEHLPPELGDRWTEPKTGLKMVYVPPGEFMMGSENGEDREKPVHKVRITQGFWLGLTPITNAMYAKFVADKGYTTQTYWTPEGWQWREKESQTGPKDYDGFTAADQPRVGVTWYEAVAFCNWAGLRLPTEAEWEYAARGPENRVYPWGNAFDANRVIYNGNSGDKAHPVGEGIRTAGASWCGALDMSGNVWEWVADWFDENYYASSPTDDPPGPPSGTTRGLRGGSWGFDRVFARAASRLRYHPVNRFGRGFRAVRAWPVSH